VRGAAWVDPDFLFLAAKRARDAVLRGRAPPLLLHPVYPRIVPETSYIALLRGINVGGKNILPMKELAALFAKAGAADVTTYIQSGNVLFKAKARAAEKVPAAVEGAVFERFGFRAPIVLRSAAELHAAVRDNPFAKPDQVDKLHLGFLASSPSAARVAALDPARSPPDEVVVRGGHVYFHLPNGVARTRYTSAYLDSTLATVCTARNWRTVLALLEKAEA
jgi:uncharacterized protein (DUF1697 family)